MTVISVATDAFWDDITGIIYLMTFRSTTTRLFPTGIGYTRHKTTKRVCDGLRSWAKCKNVQVSHLDKEPINKNYYFPLNDPQALDFGDNLADYLGFHKKHTHNHQMDVHGDILMLGPYNGIARKMHSHHHNVYSSFSNIRFPEDGSFPPTINISTWSNAGIDPLAAFDVWNQAKQPALLLARQPPIDLVINSLVDMHSWAAKKIKKVLSYSKANNPGGGYVWDLGLAIVYKNPDVITRTQLYDVNIDNVTKYLTLTLSSIRNPYAVQVYLCDVDLNQMMHRLRHQL